MILLCALGAKIHRTPFVGGTQRLPVGHLAAGVYWLTAADRNGKVYSSQPILKQ